ncbi:MAG: hypothetical protein ACM34C_05045, partial [Syntrophaceae bacterium]
MKSVQKSDSAFRPVFASVNIDGRPPCLSMPAYASGASAAIGAILNNTSDIETRDCHTITASAISARLMPFGSAELRRLPASGIKHQHKKKG